MEIARLATSLIALATCTLSVGQDFPVKPIRLIATEAGGSVDFQARLMAQALARHLGQNVIVDNRATPVAIQAAARAAPDGYTLMLNASALWVEPLLRPTPYDPVRDFAPITLATRSPLILVVHPSLPVNSIKDLIALATAKPGALNYSSGPTGGSNHLAAEMFKAMAGVSMVRVAYKGGGPAVNAVIAGEVQLLFSLAATAIPHVKSGKLRALGVTSTAVTPVASDLLPVAATLPGFELTTLTGLFAPASTPTPIVNRLHQHTAQVLRAEDIKDKLFSSSLEAIAGAPALFSTTIKSEMARLGKLIKSTGVAAESGF